MVLKSSILDEEFSFLGAELTFLDSERTLSTAFQRL